MPGQNTCRTLTDAIRRFEGLLMARDVTGLFGSCLSVLGLTGVIMLSTSNITAVVERNHVNTSGQHHCGPIHLFLFLNDGSWQGFVRGGARALLQANGQARAWPRIADELAGQVYCLHTES